MTTESSKRRDFLALTFVTKEEEEEEEEEEE